MYFRLLSGCVQFCLSDAHADALGIFMHCVDRPTVRMHLTPNTFSLCYTCKQRKRTCTSPADVAPRQSAAHNCHRLQGHPRRHTCVVVRNFRVASATLPACTFGHFLHALSDSCTFASTWSPLHRQELGDPSGKNSAGAADVITLGDTWLAAAIQRRLLQPIPNAETSRWVSFSQLGL